MLKAEETDTLDLGGPRPAEPHGAGLVTLYAADVAAVPSAILLGAHPLVLGRDPPPGELRLPSTSISRVHARVTLRGGEVVVDDLGSRNGTFVNGVKITSAVAAAHGDQIRLGDAVFKVVTRDAASYVAQPLAGFEPPSPFGALRGGAAMERVRREIALVANADLSVLVLGETGTGKELVSRALHDASGRSGRFCAVNCAAIPATLLESELFGYKRGAFTGADRDRVGLVKSAHGGTLFLDEIGDMPHEAQAKLLRMIETRTVTPLGGTVAEPVDLRLVCATHRPLEQLVREERFRADLYARIGGHVLHLPPLRARKEDVYQLAHLFLGRAGVARERVTTRFMIALLAYDWPFNVRELEGAMKRAATVAGASDLDEAHLPPAVTAAAGETATNVAPPPPDRGRGVAPTSEAMRELCDRHGGNVAAIARELGKDRVQVHRWLKRYGLVLEDFRKR